MAAAVPLREGLTALLETAAASLAATSVGVVQRDGPEHVAMTHADSFGVLAYRYPADTTVR